MDLKTGATVWKRTPVKTKSVSYAAYEHGIIAALWQGEREVEYPLFLAPKTGRNIRPFWPPRSYLDFEPKLAESHTVGDVHELQLPNGVRTVGLRELNWRNTTTNHVYFFQRSKLVFEMSFAPSVSMVKNSGGMILWKQSTNLYGTNVLSLNDGWRVELPAEIPSLPRPAIHALFTKTPVRNPFFDVIDDAVVIECNGYLVWVEPNSGKVSETIFYWPRELPTQTEPRTQPPEIVAAGNFFLIGKAPYLFCFDASSRKIVWCFDTRLEGYCEPMVYDGRVYTFAAPKAGLIKLGKPSSVQ